jgi:L,D-peptidoglycan transpeptidase YkuD (ErfK/YbiS/YcfS/YnhG family)
MNIVVKANSSAATTGTLEINGKHYTCTLGKTGVIPAAQKTEGDGKTPLGIFPLRQLLYRADRIPKPATGLPLEILAPETGWCEDSTHADYNKKIILSSSCPHPAMHDRMTREDHLYDYVVVIGYNDAPVAPGKGSAIFMHLARPDFTPTRGCVGLRVEDMLEVLRHCDSSSKIEIKIG